MKKISVATFVSVGRGISGPSDAAASIAEYLYEKKLLGKVICPFYEAHSCRIPKGVFFTPLNKSSYRLLDLAVYHLGRLLRFKTRRIREELFDLLLSIKLSYDSSFKTESSDLMLFLKPVFARTVATTRTKGFKTAGYASILHPYFNFEQIKKEEKRFFVKDTSSYTDRKRARNLNRFFNTIDYLLVESEMVRDIYVRYGISCEKVHVLNNTTGVDCTQFSPGKSRKNNKTFTVLHISHVNLIKGVGYLFEAWKALELDGSKLILAGKMDSTVRDIFKKISPPDTVSLGPVSNTTEWYRRADVFVSPSVSDRGPNTILEAMACGLPVIASNKCGWSTIINHGKDGFVYQYDDVKALKKYILWCYENRATLKKMGQCAREKALQYQQKDWVPRLVDAIMKVAY